MNKPALLRSNHIYVFGLILLVAAMPLSMYMMSLAQFVLGASFLVEGNFTEKIKRLFRNKAALVIIGILVMHIIGMLWTDNTSEGWKDIRIKLPLLSLTVIMACNEPLSARQFRVVLGFFILAVFAGTMISMAVLVGIIHREIYDIRNVFIFHISHIRFALFTDIAIFSLLYFSFKDEATMRRKILSSVIAGWFLIFLFIVESLTGLTVLAIVLLVFLIASAWTARKAAWRFSILGITAILSVFAIVEIGKIYHEYYTAKPYPVNVEDKTAEGNSYTFDFSSSDLENGYPVWVYMCDQELKREWNTRSGINYDSLDKRSQPLKFTLIRFLASKGLHKDGQAVKELNSEEINLIENGIANVNYKSLSDIHSRLFQIVWEYDHFTHGSDPSGHSVMQRLEFWKAAVGIIKENILVGVGTGDMPQAYHEQYQRMNTKLSLAYRLRAHNQFLAITVAFGIIGLIYFLFALIYPGITMNRMRDYFYMTFLITVILSMISEDTIETQAGATFFAFFNAFFLFAKPEQTIPDAHFVRRNHEDDSH